MKIYKILIKAKAEKFLLKQSKKSQIRILKALKQLPFGDIKKLKGYENLNRLRVGDIRVIFTVDEESSVITIINIGNRGDVY